MLNYRSIFAIYIQLRLIEQLIKTSRLYQGLNKCYFQSDKKININDNAIYLTCIRIVFRETFDIGSSQYFSFSECRRNFKDIFERTLIPD